MRNTPLLKAVKDIFTSNQKPITVPQLQEFLAKKNLNPNKTSLYRMLEKLAKESFIDEILLDSKAVYYEIKTHHHHHFSCDDCGLINCIEDNVLEKNIHTLEDKLRESGVSIANHHFFFSGKCIDCA